MRDVAPKPEEARVADGELPWLLSLVHQLTGKGSTPVPREDEPLSWEEAPDPAVTTSTSRKGSVGESKWSIGGQATRTRALEELGQEVKAERSASFEAGSDGVTVEGSLSQSVLEDGVGAGSSTTGSLSWGDDGPSAKLSHARETSLAEGWQETRGGSLSFSSDSIGASFDTSSAFETADGGKGKTSSSTTLSFGEDGPSAGRTFSSSREGADGSTEQSSYGVQLSEDSLSANASHATTTADGRKRTLSGQAGVKRGEDGSIEQISAKGSAGGEHFSVGAHGELVFGRTETETLADGRVAVTTTDRVAGGANLGATGSFGPDASEAMTGGMSKKQKALADDAFGSKMKGQASVGFQGHSERKETRVFDSAEDAKRFEEAGGPALDVGDVRSWNAGEAVTTSEGSAFQASGSIDTGVFSGGLQVGTSDSTDVSVARTDEDAARIDHRSTETDSLGGSLEAPVAGMQVGNVSKEWSGVGADVDLSHPAAQQALDWIRATGTLPLPGTPAAEAMRSWETRTGNSSTDSVQANLGPLKAGVSSGTSSEHIQHSDGSQTQIDSGHRGASASLFGEKHSFENALTMTDRMLPDGSSEAMFRATGSVESTDAEGTQNSLADALGVGADKYWADDRGERNWSLSYELSEQDMTEFLASAVEGKAARWELSPYQMDALDDLVEKVQNAGRQSNALALFGIEEEKRQALFRSSVGEALSEFVADGGSGALAAVRTTLGRGTGGADLQLEGDEFYDGGAWRRQADLVMGSVRQSIASGEARPGALRRLVRGRMALIERRQQAVGDPRRYPDLPAALRAREERACASVLRELEGVLAEVDDYASLYNAHQDAMADHLVDSYYAEYDPEALRAAGIDDGLMGPVREDWAPEETGHEAAWAAHEADEADLLAGDQPEQTATAPVVSAHEASTTELLQQANRAVQGSRATYERVRATRYVHSRYAMRHAGRNNDYERADALLTDAAELLHTLEDNLLTARLAAIHAETPADHAAAQARLQDWVLANTASVEARFAEVQAIYDAIRADHADKHWWSEDTRLPDGY